MTGGFLKQRHRMLLKCSVFDKEDLLLLIDAAACGDLEVLQHAAFCGVEFSSVVLDRAVMNMHLHCIDIIADQNLVYVSGHLVD